MSPKFDLGKLASKARDVAEKSGGKIAAGVDKVTDKLDEKTGGKYHDKLEKIDHLTSRFEKDVDRGVTGDEGESAATSTEGAVADATAPFPEPSPPQSPTSER